MNNLPSPVWEVLSPRDRARVLSLSDGTVANDAELARLVCMVAR